MPKYESDSLLRRGTRTLGARSNPRPSCFSIRHGPLPSPRVHLASAPYPPADAAIQASCRAPGGAAVWAHRPRHDRRHVSGARSPPEMTRTCSGQVARSRWRASTETGQLSGRRSRSSCEANMPWFHSPGRSTPTSGRQRLRTPQDPCAAIGDPLDRRPRRMTNRAALRTSWRQRRSTRTRQRYLL